MLAGNDRTFKVQRLDIDGTIVTDAWMDLLSITWNTDLNESFVTIPNFLSVAESITVNGKNVESELNNKAPISNPIFPALEQLATFMLGAPLRRQISKPPIPSAY